MIKKIMFVAITTFLVATNTAKGSCFSYSIDYERVGENLYEKDGEILFKTMSMCDGSKKSKLTFIHTFHDLSDLAIPGKKLTEVVDKDTWEKVAGYIYRDKNHVYFHTTSICGGYLYIKEGLKPEAVKYVYENELITPLEKRHHEWEVKSLKDVNYYISTGDTIYYLYSNAQMVTEDVENFKVEFGDGYDAKDSKHYYSRGDIVGDIEKE